MKRRGFLKGLTATPMIAGGAVVGVGVKARAKGPTLVMARKI